MRIGFNGLIGIQLTGINLSGLFESLFQFFSDWNDVSFVYNILRELRQILFFGHLTKGFGVEVLKNSEFGVLVVFQHVWGVGVVGEVDWLQRYALRVIFLEIIREIPIKDV